MTTLTMAIVPVIMAVLLLAASAAWSLLEFLRSDRYITDDEALEKTLRGLIQRNNIDRAIMMVNALSEEKPDAPFARCAKLLITRSHWSDEERERAHDESTAIIRALRGRTQRRKQDLSLASQGIYCVALGSLAFLCWDTWWALLAVVLMLLLFPLTHALRSAGYRRVLDHLDDVEPRLVRIRDVLSQRRTGIRNRRGGS